MVKQAFKILLLIIVSIMSGCNATKAAHDIAPIKNLIIYYEPETGNEELLKAAKQYGSDILYVYKNINGIAVTVPKSKTVSDAIKYYEKIKGVLSVAKDEKMQLD